MAAPQYGLPTLGGGGIDPSLGGTSSALFSSAGHGPPQSMTPAPQARQPSIAYNPVENSMFVNGQVVKMDDYAGLANSPLALMQPAVPKPPGDSWHDVPISSYEGIVNEIKDPTLSAVAKRNFQQALYGMQEIGYGAVGAISGALGAEGAQNWAHQGAARANKEQERFAPFNYQFGTAADDNNVRAFVGAVAQAAPWMVESIFSGLAGAAPALLRGAVGKSISGQALSATEKAALVAASRQAAYRGSLAGVGVSSYGTGIGDVYNESLQAGSPDPAGAMLRGIPYALTDALPEAGALALGLGKLGSVSKYVGGMKMPARIAAGAVGGAVGEGVNEAIQEGILVNEHQSIDPNYDPGNRVAQAGLGGAAPGLLMGGLAGGVAPKHKPIVNNPNVQTNLLQVAQTAAAERAATPAPPTGPVEFPTTGPVSYSARPPQQPVMPPGQMSLLAPDAVPFTQEQTKPGPAAPNWGLQEPYQPFQLTSPPANLQGPYPDQRTAPVAPDNRTGSMFAGEQLQLLPDPAQVIPPGQQTLMERRNTGVAPVNPQQGELKFPKQKALKKGTPNAEGIHDNQGQTGQRSPSGLPPVQPSPVGSSSNLQQAAPGATALKQAGTAQPVAPQGKESLIKKKLATAAPLAPTLKKSPEVAPIQPAPAQPTLRPEPSPPGKERAYASSSNDAAVEDAFSNEKFAQQTLDEAIKSKSELQWHNSVAQAIKKRPDLEGAIKSYIDDLTPGAAKEYEDFQQGNAADDAELLTRGRKVATVKVGAQVGKVVARTTSSTEKAAEAAMKLSPESRLHDLITNKHNLEPKATFVAKVKALYAEATKNAGDGVLSHKLSSYFTDGEPNIIRTNNRNVLVPYTPTPEKVAEFSKREKAMRDELDAVAQEIREEDADEARRIANDYVADQVSDEMSAEALADKWNTNSYVNIHTGEVLKPQSVGVLRLKAASVLSKFKLVPKVIVVDNFKALPQFIQEELKQKGDTNDISGVSFRDQVYIVADKIHGIDHLRSVILHEVLGHFGIRSLVDSALLENILTDIYDNDPVIRAEANALRDSGRYAGREDWELVEEALAERAPDVPNNLIQRLWNVIKVALRKLGFNVEVYNDPGLVARSLLNASYRYVRDGVHDQALPNRPSTWANEVLASVNPTNVSRLTAEEAVLKNIQLGGTNHRKAFGEYIKHKVDPLGAKVNVENAFRGLVNKFQTTTDVARRNGGYALFMELIQHESRRIHELLNQYNEDTSLLHDSGFTPSEQTVLASLLYQTTRAKLQSLSDASIRELKLLYTKPDGSVAVDPKVLESLKKMGRFTVDDFAKGIEIQYTTDRELTDADRERLKSDRDAKIKKHEDLANVRVAAATDDKIKKDILAQLKRDVAKEESRYQSALADGSVTITHKIREAPIKIDPESQVWRAYHITRDALDQAQVDMVIAKHTAHKIEATAVYQRAMSRLENDKKGAPAKVVAAFAKDVADTYRSIMTTNMTVDDTGRTVIDPAQYGRADAMLNAVGRALYKDQAFADLLQYFGTQEHVDKLTGQIQQIRGLNNKISDTAFETNTWDFIAGLRTQFTELLGMDEAEMYAKKSIAGGHIALRRYGDFELNIVLKDAAGNLVTPSEKWDNNLMYMRFLDQGSAEVSAAEMNASLSKIRFEVRDDSGQMVTVTPHAFARSAETIGPLGHKISLYDFLTVADRLGVHLSAKDRETVIKALTKADAKARRSLQRGGNPGEDKDVVKVASEMLESAAHIVANQEHRRQLDNLMADNSKWFGNSEQRDTWTALRDQARSSGAYDAANRYQKLVDRWNLEYKDAAKNGYYYKALANNLREWRDQQASQLASTENKVISSTKAAVSAAQLGGYAANIASAAVQLFTLVTHVPAHLATYNPKTAYGGGFGMARAYTSIVAAARDVGAYDLGNVTKLKKKIDSLNLTANEKQFLIDETKEGVFQAAQFNALMNSKLGTGRMFGLSNRANKLLQGWMKFFSWSEEANRRITGLAAYRLFYERALQQGLAPDSAHSSAVQEARQVVYQTQGDYSMMNRPAWARSGFTSLLFMYKMFPIITVQLVKNLPWKGRLMFAGTMLLLGGFKSLPFAEDLLDILDGVVQRFGIGTSLTHGNAELALREFVDSFFPGMSPIAARGLLDYMTGMSLSSRIGVGDIIPATGFARAGAELSPSDLQGPAGGVIASLYKMSTEALHQNYGRALREVPVTAAKNVIEGLIYLNNGAILNKKGYTVATDPTASETIARFMGFYPERQAQSNEFVQSMKYSENYIKEIKGDFVSRYVSAKLDGDADKVARIQAEVQAWNQDAKGTEMEIRDFGTAAGRAYAAARRPQVDVFLRSAPTAIRRERAYLKTLYGVDD